MFDDKDPDAGCTLKEKAFLAKVRELTNAERNGYRFLISRRISASICFQASPKESLIRFPDDDKFRNPEVIAQAVEMYRQGAFIARRDAIAEQQAKLRELCGMPVETNDDE
jgi:hypothetical protein